MTIERPMFPPRAESVDSFSLQPAIGLSDGQTLTGDSPRPVELGDDLMTSGSTFYAPPLKQSRRICGGPPLRSPGRLWSSHEAQAPIGQEVCEHLPKKAMPWAPRRRNLPYANKEDRHVRRRNVPTKKATQKKKFRWRRC
jgi:hypothetical protein